jgi:ferric-dicitrate binding protein FerR (iron transport regulator)
MRDFNEYISDLKSQKAIDSEKAWTRLSRKIALFSFRKKTWNVVRTAAAVLLPLFLLHQYAIQPAPPETITLVSAPGIVTKVVLPDGSEVWLNAQSELSYPQRFTGKERTVRMSGEAYFKVEADKKRRFNVEAGDVTVSAFGTEFNVQAYRDVPEYQVTLTRGNIEVKGEALEAGQKAVLTTQTGNMRIVQADTYKETAWRDGRMVFRREKLETIAQTLSRKFGVTIRLEGAALKNYEYTATFTDETLEDILELLKRSAPVTYSISRQEKLTNDTFTHRTVTIK